MNNVARAFLGAVVCAVTTFAVSSGASAGSNCGNGSLDAGEECDDGNTMSLDGCSSLCMIELICGDGLVIAPEECDGTDLAGGSCVSEGFDMGTLACDATCAYDTSGCSNAPVCGDGVVGGTEECDDGAANSDTTPDACRTDCTDAGCGDGTVDTAEECDDGNITAGDGCDDACLTEPACGDGTIDAGEDCDDGNTTGGDGCDALCQNEPACGDGTIDAGEDCDDGNTTGGDGCSALCVSEPVCGNGTVEAGEECEPPGSDTCDASCMDIPEVPRGCNCDCRIGARRTFPAPLAALLLVVAIGVGIRRRR